MCSAAKRAHETSRPSRQHQHTTRVPVSSLICRCVHVGKHSRASAWGSFLPPESWPSHVASLQNHGSQWIGLEGSFKRLATTPIEWCATAATNWYSPPELTVLNSLSDVMQLEVIAQVWLVGAILCHGLSVCHAWEAGRERGLQHLQHAGHREQSCASSGSMKRPATDG